MSANDRAARAIRRAAASATPTRGPDRIVGSPAPIHQPMRRTPSRTPSPLSTRSSRTHPSQRQQPADDGSDPSTATGISPDDTPESLDHLLYVVFKQPPDGPLQKAIAELGIDSYAAFITYSSDDFKELTYRVPQPPDPQGRPQRDKDEKVPKHICSLCRGFLGFILYRANVLRNPINPKNCLQISEREFREYRHSPHFQVFNNTKSDNSPATLAPVQSQRTKADEFKRNIKIDPSSYPYLREDKGFNSFEINVVALARTHGMSNVLDPLYQPVTHQDTELFRLHQNFMFSMFALHVSTTKGKQLIRRYNKTSDAQSFWSDLVKYHRVSTKADGTKQILMEWLTTTTLDRENWHGSHEDFIDYWLEQLRLYHELAPDSPMSEELCFTLLSHAVAKQEHLANVKNTSDLLQAAAANFGQPPFDMYVKLLDSAAVRYDRNNPITGRRGNRSVSLHEQLESNFDRDNPTLDFNIDTTIDDLSLYQANRTSTTPGRFSSKPRCYPIQPVNRPPLHPLFHLHRLTHHFVALISMTSAINPWSSVWGVTTLVPPPRLIPTTLPTLFWHI